MNKRIIKNIAKVLTLIAVVISILLSIPTSVAPEINDVVNKENASHESVNSSTHRKENLTQSVLLNDADDSNDFLSDNINTNINNTNNNINTNNNNSDNNNESGDNFNPNNNQDHELKDDDNHYAPGDLTNSTSDTTLKYFDVTLFNYQTDGINNATKIIDNDDGKDVWEGIYFRNESNLNNETAYKGYYMPSFEDNRKAIIENGQYLIQSSLSNQVLKGKANSINGVSNEALDDATLWTITKVDGGYTVQNEIGQYLTVGYGTGPCKLTNDRTVLDISGFENNDTEVQIGIDNNYLNWWTGTGNHYGGYDKGDNGNKMRLVKTVNVEATTNDFEVYTPTFSDDFSNATIEEDQYYLVNMRTFQFITGNTTNIVGHKSIKDSHRWTIVPVEGGYYVKNPDGKYLSVGNETAVLTDEPTVSHIRGYSQVWRGAVEIGDGTYYLNQFNGAANTIYKGYGSTSDFGNAILLVKASDTLNINVYQPSFPDDEAVDNNAVIDNGEYYILNKRSRQFLYNNENKLFGTENFNDATLWQVEKTAEGYAIKDQNGKYINVNGNGTENIVLTDTKANLVINQGTGEAGYIVQIGNGNQYINQYGGYGSYQYGGHHSGDDGNDMLLIRKVSYTADFGVRNLIYAPWNSWTGIHDGRAGYTFNSIVKNRLDSNGNIQFNFPQAGIFEETSTSYKDVYTNVGLPFLYTNGLYSFDALADSARFVDGAASNKRLTWNDQTQRFKDNYTNAQKDAGFLPFNDGGIVDVIDNPVYHFGMKVELDFYMTPDGKSIVDGKDVHFDFAGDDDVWVFIDGKLVLDMGGIHDSVDGHINFAQNSAVVNSTKDQYASGYFDTNNGNPYDSNNQLISTETAVAGEKPEPMKLFNEGQQQGILETTREDFSNMKFHTLTIYYLERGSSDSNFELSFNLPVNDTVSVSKNITPSKTKGGITSPLTDEEQAFVDKLDYTFVLYKDGQPLCNHPYRLLDKDLHLLTTALTDANGEFSIKNTQIASFVDEIGTGDKAHSYYVKEKPIDGFETPDFVMIQRGAGEPIRHPIGTGWTSNEYDVEGLNTYMDNVAFVYTNYLSADVPNPSLYTNDDQYVLDFGVTANLGNVLTNDVYKGDSITLTDVYCPANNNSTTSGLYGTFEVNEKGEILYTLNTQLTKPEVLKYTATVTTVENEATYTKTGTGTIYIMPATSIYYEEDFGFVEFKTAAGVESWKQIGTSNGNVQESGRVGNSEDSPYGSDSSYSDDSKDSNGTCYYVNTTHGAAAFTYEFTGTGTSFFTRTSNKTGTMRIIVRDMNDNNKIIYQRYRSTTYQTDDDNTTLYNIPVFTYNAPKYGKYKVEVTIAKLTLSDDGTKVVNQPEFYLDGITVFNPLNQTHTSQEELDLITLTKSAYVADLEANNTIATLRDKIITDYVSDDQSWTGDQFVIFTDSDGSVYLGDNDNGESDETHIFINNGPKEEVYMVDGQSIKFALKGWEVSDHRVYLGLKAPMGPSAVLINGHRIEINNTKECYYDITNYVTLVEETPGVYVPVIVIEADKTEENTLGLISVTNIRVTGKVEFDIVPNKIIE